MSATDTQTTKNAIGNTAFINIVGGGGNFTFDALAVPNVPEPDTYAILGFSLQVSRLRRQLPSRAIRTLTLKSKSGVRRPSAERVYTSLLTSARNLAEPVHRAIALNRIPGGRWAAGVDDSSIAHVSGKSCNSDGPNALVFAVIFVLLLE